MKFFEKEIPRLFGNNIQKDSLAVYLRMPEAPNSLDRVLRVVRFSPRQNFVQLIIRKPTLEHTADRFGDGVELY